MRGKKDNGILLTHDCTLNKSETIVFYSVQEAVLCSGVILAALTALRTSRFFGPVPVY